MSSSSKVAKHLKIKFPKISDSHNAAYHVFVKNFLLMPGNRQAIASMKRETFNAEYEQQVRSIFKMDEKVANRFLEDVSTPGSTSVVDH